MNDVGVRMAYEETKIKGVWLFQPETHTDARGIFYEGFQKVRMLDQTGFDFRVSQVNTSVSKRGVIRGIHFKKYPPGQAKFVTVDVGRILDVVIDLRSSSPTFLEWQAFELSADNNLGLLLTYGIGHAFLAIEKESKVNYLCDTPYEPALELSINPMDSNIPWLELAEPWGVRQFFLSERDRLAPSLLASTNLMFE